MVAVSWRLRFYRRVGQEPLTLDEVRPFFAREGGEEEAGTSLTAPDTEAVRFPFEVPESGGEYAFQFVPGGEVAPPDLDFPYEETDLFLVIDPLQEPAVAKAAVETARRLCETLRLLAADLQRDAPFPALPDPEALAASYAAYSEDIALTIQAAGRQRRRFMLIALGLIVAYVVVSILGLAHRPPPR
jgi:hypothetical protein